MVEILYGAKKIFTVTKRDLTLTLVITANALPYVSQHQLLLLLSNWTDEAEFKEKLWHLCTSDFDIRLVCVSVLRLLDNVKLETCFLEVSIKPIVDHFVGKRVNLYLWHHWLLFQGGFISLLLLLSTICVLENSVQISLHVLCFVTDLRVKLEIFILLTEIVFPSHLFFEYGMLIHAHWISKVTLSRVPLNLDNSLRCRIDSWMMCLQIHEFLLMSYFL